MNLLLTCYEFTMTLRMQKIAFDANLYTIARMFCT